MPICTRYTLVELTPKYPTLVASIPPRGLHKGKWGTELTVRVTPRVRLKLFYS